MTIINSQLGGKKPTGTKQITTNGVHDVTDYASADVQVPTTAPELYRVFRNNNGKLDNTTNMAFIPLPSSVTDVGDYCLYNCYKGSDSSVLYGAIDLSNLTDVSGSSALSSMFQECQGITSVDLSGLITATGYGALGKMFWRCLNLTSVDLSSLTTVGKPGGSSVFSSIFQHCTSLTSVDLSSLTTINGDSAFQYAFNGCSGLTNIDLSSLTTINSGSAFQYAFSGCSNLASVDLSGLTTIAGRAGLSSSFQNCSSLTSISFSSLKSMVLWACSEAFKNSTGLTSISFPAITSSSFVGAVNQLNSLIGGVTGCTIHFPSNLDPQGGSTVISSLATYPNFGGTNTVLAFDLPSTAHLIGADTVEYERSPKFDTGTALAWRVNDTAVTATTYYTSGTTDPSVGDTIYSDSACTTAETTISSIA